MIIGASPFPELEAAGHAGIRNVKAEQPALPVVRLGHLPGPQTRGLVNYEGVRNLPSGEPCLRTPCDFPLSFPGGGPVV
jgi:hypothetical protein